MKVKSKAAIGRGEELNRNWDGWRRAMVEVTPTATTLVAIICFLVRLDAEQRINLLSYKTRV